MEMSPQKSRLRTGAWSSEFCRTRVSPAIKEKYLIRIAWIWTQAASTRRNRIVLSHERKNMNALRRLVTFVVLVTLAVASTLPTSAQQPGSPGATTTLDGKQV